MVIRKMNSIFGKHGRIFFGAITVIIIITFVGFLTPGFTDIIFGSGSNPTYGKAFGRKIDRQSVVRQAGYNLIASAAEMGRFVAYQQLEDWAQRYAVCAIVLRYAAEERGIAVSDDEVAEYVMNLPVFKADPAEAWTNFIASAARWGYTAEDVTEALRNELIIQKLNNELISSSLATNDEVALFEERRTEKFAAQVAAYKSEDYLDKVEFTEADVQKFFEANRPVIPEQRKVLLARFDLIGDITDPEILNKARSQAETKANFFAEKFEEVVSDANRKKESIEMPKIFREMAMAEGANIFEEGPFSIETDAIGEIKSPEYIRMVGRNQSKSGFIPPAVLNRGVYVTLITEKIPARNGTFEEFKEEFTQSYKAGEALKLARDAAGKRAKLFAEHHGENLAFLVKRAVNPKFEDFPIFSINEPPPSDTPNLFAIAGTAVKMQPNSISGALDVNDGAVIVYLLSRTIDEAKERDTAAATARRIYERQKSDIISMAFRSYVISRCDPEIAQMVYDYDAWASGLSGLGL